MPMNFHVQDLVQFTRTVTTVAFYQVFQGGNLNSDFPGAGANRNRD